jgi:AcrR family transcriptional regulator
MEIAHSETEPPRGRSTDLKTEISGAEAAPVDVEFGPSERRIIQLAAAVLAEGQGRSMQEVADKSGVGRTTLYRHFKTREDLIRAIQVLALEEVSGAVQASRLEEGPADEALGRLIAALCAIGDKYRVLLSHQNMVMKDMKADISAGIPLRALVERGQREGAFNPAVPASWILSAMGGLLLAAIKNVHEGEIARNHAAELVTGTLLSGIGMGSVARDELG